MGKILFGPIFITTMNMTSTLDSHKQVVICLGVYPNPRAFSLQHLLGVTRKVFGFKPNIAKSAQGQEMDGMRFLRYVYFYQWRYLYNNTKCRLYLACPTLLSRSLVDFASSHILGISIAGRLWPSIMELLISTPEVHGSLPDPPNFGMIQRRLTRPMRKTIFHHGFPWSCHTQDEDTFPTLRLGMTRRT